MEGIGYYLYVDILVVLSLIKMSKFPTYNILIFILVPSFWIWLLDLVEIFVNLIVVFKCGLPGQSSSDLHFMKQIISGKLLLTTKREVAHTR